MKIKTILKIVLALVVTVVVVAGVLLATLDVNKYKGVITAQAEKATGRTLVIEGDLDLSISLSPAVVVNGVRFANAPWGSGEDMLAVERFEAEIALIPALMGDIQVRRLVLIKPQILLETDASGTGNWVFDTSAEDMAEAVEAAEDQTEGLTLPTLSAVTIREAQVTYRDGVSGEVITLTLDELTARADSLGSPLDVVLKGAYNQTAFDFTGRLGTLDHLMSGGSAPWPLVLNGRAAGIELSLNGGIAQPLLGEGLDLQFSVKADTLEGLKPFTGDLPALPPVSVSGRLSGGTTAIAVSDLDLTAGRSKVTGSVAASLAGARPSVDATLQAALVDLGELLPAGPESAAPAAPAASGGRVLPQDPLPLDGLKAADAVFDIAIARLLTADGIEVEGISLKGSLTNGRLTLDPAAARLGGGSITARVGLDASSGTSAALDLSLTADSVVLGTLFEQIRRPDLLTGSTTNATITLRGSGASVAALAGSLTGGVEIRIGEGRIHNSLIDWAGADVFAQLRDQLNPLGERRDYTELSCGVIKLGARDGMLTWDKQVAFETSRMNMVSSGNLNLKTEGLDIGISPYAKGGTGISAGRLVEMLRLGGTMANPQVGIDAAGAARAAASVGLGIATGGLSLLAEGLIDRGVRDATPCATALGAAPTPMEGSESQPQEQTTSPLPSVPDAGQVLEGVGRGLGGLLGR